LKSEPGSAEGHYLLGKALFNEKKYGQAKEELRKSLRLGHGNGFAAKSNDMMLQMPKTMVAPKKLQLTQAKIRGRKVAAAGLTRPRILSFSAKWAEPCKQLQADLDKAKAEFGDQVEIYTVDVDDPKNEQLINQYDVSPVPTVVFLDEKGKVVNFLIGYSDSAELERSIKKVLNKS
jgi:thioredoxin-like negative regulator of GroEL